MTKRRGRASDDSDRGLYEVELAVLDPEVVLLRASLLTT